MTAQKSRKAGLGLAAIAPHPGSSGRRKVAEQLLRFFKTDPLAKGWFCGKEAK
jgi:hypothetical protein